MLHYVEVGVVARSRIDVDRLDIERPIKKKRIPDSMTLCGRGQFHVSQSDVHGWQNTVVNDTFKIVLATDG